MNDFKPAPLYSLQRPLRWIWHFQYAEWFQKKKNRIDWGQDTALKQNIHFYNSIVYLPEHSQKAHMWIS